uniref:Uncharacterized protein n=1 Tax=Florenciella sp. virus SA2 TaxID=3240092 RepID=A0AB39J8M9_9VIRU
MPKAPRAENLIQLMEWLRLGKRFHIHKDFLKYLKITEIIPLCLVSKHYYKKYLNYCYNYFMTSCSPILHIVKHNDWFLCDTPNISSPTHPSRAPNPKNNKNSNIIINHSNKLKKACTYYWPTEMISYEEFCDMKNLYKINKKITNLVDKYFAY